MAAMPDLCPNQGENGQLRRRTIDDALGHLDCFRLRPACAMGTI